MEPIYAPDTQGPQKLLILIVIFENQYNCGEVCIFDASHLDAKPVCHLGLLKFILMGLHRIWNQDE